ncbi:ACT domain-containing protein [uncultured Negativibacillus sp.]|uniref:ACT domain-containing protein n=1 Tax=uncultured Negativibacillus sp. TaxID=1980696 RepID=UPI0025CDA914|nr:ACT domain-containing protein [uncultured Negativibacillus sp.]
MANEEKYLLVDERVVPEIFKKVLEAKKYIATGKAKNSSEAVKLANISRSAFYKYKDRVMEYNSQTANNIITLYLMMEDVPGVLSSVINHLAEYGANILTINQNIPSDGVAAVTISIRTTDVTLEEEQLFERLRQLRGVVRLSKVS